MRDWRPLALAVLAAVIIVSGVLVVVGSGPDGSPSAAPTAGSATRAVSDDEVLRDPALAAAVPVSRLLDSTHTGAPSPAPTADGGRVADLPTEGPPVYVVQATVDRGAATVSFDAVLAFRTRVELNAVPLLLAALRHAAGDVEAEPELTITRDGEPVHVGHRYALGLMLAQLDPPVPAGDPVRLRIQGSYRVPDVSEIELPERAGEARPAFLSRSGNDLLLLGWLPTLTLAAEGGHTPLPGRSGRSPPARWSVTVRGAPHVASSGMDRTCPGPDAEACTWIVGDALTELAAIATDPLPVVSREAGRVELRLAGPADTADIEDLADIVATSHADLSEDLGPLPWGEVDLVPASISDLDIIGLSTPGLVFLERAVYADPGGPLARELVAHELAHQWFGALLATDSDAAPLIHESAAQYLAYVELARHEGQDLADGFATRLRSYYRDVMRPIGRLEEPPADPSFDLGPEARAALWYGRGALGWITAERTAGREAVLTTFAELVDGHRFGFVQLEDVRELAPPAIEAVLETYWFAYGQIPD